MSNKRLHYLDVAKGILILLLLVDHFGVVSGDKSMGLEPRYFAGIFFFHPLFTTFYMQCFFFISGYCSNFHRDGKTFMTKQFKELVVPILFFGIVSGLYFWLRSNRVESFSFITYWFLNALLFSKVTCWILVKYVKSEMVQWAIVTAMLIAGVLLNHYQKDANVLSLYQCLASCFFVLLGISIKKHSKAQRFLIRYAWGGYVIFWAITYAFHLAFTIPKVTGSFMDFELYKIPLIIIVPILGIFTCLRICQLINHNKILEYFGRNTLVIYGLHIIPFYYIVRAMSEIYVPMNIFTGAIFDVSACLVEACVMAIVIKLFFYPPLKYGVGRW